jgi:hypothetical protein
MADPFSDSEMDRTRAGAGTEKYASFSVDEDICVVYDTDNHEAWIQSDAAVDAEEVR